jgi:carbonic anhydrase/acetyltransferase-like protein (isoleucine patch superfamily)
MPIFRFADRAPRIDPRAIVYHSAIIIGDVELGPGANIWPGAVLRGDFGSIAVGAGTCIQDNCVVHATPELPTLIGRDCIIGHLAFLEGCVIEDAVLVGAHASVLRGALMRSGSVAAAAALVREKMEVPGGFRAQGVPARLVPSRVDAAAIVADAGIYKRMAERQQAELIELDAAGC